MHQRVNSACVVCTCLVQGLKVGGAVGGPAALSAKLVALRACAREGGARGGALDSSPESLGQRLRFNATLR
eukprot:6394882-Alexandrium_andersonii.AAC.1